MAALQEGPRPQALKKHRNIPLLQPVHRICHIQSDIIHKQLTAGKHRHIKIAVRHIGERPLQPVDPLQLMLQLLIPAKARHQAEYSNQRPAAKQHIHRNRFAFRILLPGHQIPDHQLCLGVFLAQ